MIVTYLFTLVFGSLMWAMNDISYVTIPTAHKASASIRNDHDERMYDYTSTGTHEHG